MNLMKKKRLLFLAAALCACLFAGCKGQPKDDGEKLSIVTTIFPEYDWVRNILGEKAADADVTMLLGSGVDLHSYQSTADDMIQIANCDVFLYVGGESDEWVEDALKGEANPDRMVVNLLESLGDAAKEEEIVEGMEDEDGHGEADHAGEDHAEGAAYDEHVWLSLKNAAVLCNVIKDALCEADAANQEIYAANTSAYVEKLNALDAKYQAAVDAAQTKTILFGDRFPFRYLADDYGLSYFAAFAGCSAETEASFETVAFLAEKVDELGLPAVLTLEGSDQKIAKTIVDTTQEKAAQILTMDSMQSTTSEDVKNGASYLDIMEKNLDALKEALG